jgi:hypothetical protein
MMLLIEIVYFEVGGLKSNFVCICIVYNESGCVLKDFNIKRLQKKLQNKA